MTICFHLHICFDVSETCKLIKMSSEILSWLRQSLVSSWNKASSFDDIMSIVKSNSWEILIGGMNFKFIEGVKRSNGMLPDVTDYIMELSLFEHVNRVRRHPVLHIDVSCFLIKPIRLIFRHYPSYWKIFIFSWQSCINSCLLCPPFTKSTSLEIIYLSWPIPRHLDLLW